MGYKGYFQLGGRELANAERFKTYVRAFLPGMSYFPAFDSDTLPLALGDEQYREPVADAAPWVDTSDPSSAGFYGAVVLDVDGLEDSTRDVTITENINSGGSAGRTRFSSREIRIKLLLAAADDLAMAAGWAWLKATLNPSTCSQHGSSCGGADFCYFAAEPQVYPGMVDDTTLGGEIESFYQAEAGAPIIWRFLSPYGWQWVQWGLLDSSLGQIGPILTDGAVVRYGALYLDSDDFRSISGPIRVRRTNYVLNPRFASDALHWAATGGTVTQQGTGGNTWGQLDQTTPLVFASNWVPDPSFEHGDPETFGWRSITPGGITQVADGTAPQGTHVAVVAAVAGKTELDFSATGPTTEDGTPVSGWLSFWSALNPDDIVVTVLDNHGVQVQTFTIPHTSLTSAWQRVGHALTAFGTNYVIQFTTAGTHELRVDGFMLEQTTSASTYFDGDTTDAGTTNYYYIGGLPANGSRKAIGTVASYTVNSDATSAPAAADVLSFEVRSDFEATLTADLVDASSTVVASTTVPVTPNWTRHNLNVVNGLGALVRFIGTGPNQVRNIMFERGTEILPYFDGSTVAPAGYTSSWSGASGDSQSYQDYTDAMITEYNDPDWRPYFEVLSGGPVATVNMDGRWHDPILPADCVAPYERRQHDVTCIQGPTVTSEVDLGQDGFIRTATIILNAGLPFIFSNTERVHFDEGINPMTSGYFSDYDVNLSTNPSGETSAAGYVGIPGTTGVMAALTNPTATTSYGTRVVHGQWSTASTAAGGGLQAPDMAVVAGLPYCFSVRHVLSSIVQRLQLQVEWRTSTTSISTVTTAPQQVMAAGVALEKNASFVLENLIAPPTATIARVKVISVAGTSYANWSIGSYLELDGIIGHFGVALLPYFDGDHSLNAAYDYAWTGTAELSTSTRTLHVIDTDPGDLVDPSLPVVPDPPQPPFIVDPAVANQPTNWLRYYGPIPADQIAGWSDSVPTIEIDTTGTQVRFMRFRFTPNPFGLDPLLVDPTAYCAEFIVSYVPPETSFTIDGALQRAFAEVMAGPAQAANQMLYSTDGSPVIYPELDCNIAYLMTIDIPATQNLTSFGVELSLTKRE